MDKCPRCGEHRLGGWGVYDDVFECRSVNVTYEPEHKRYKQSGVCKRLCDQQVEIKRLRATVDRLPKTADGVPITVGIEVWVWDETVLWHARVWNISADSAEIPGMRKRQWFRKLYSTKKAAEAAGEET